MAIREIGYYPAVVTPATTDEFFVQQKGVSKKVTTSLLLDTITHFIELSVDDIDGTSYVMGTQSGGQVKISVSQIITYIKSITYPYFFNGYTTTVVQDCEQYDMVNASWSDKADVPLPARFQASSAAVSNRAYVVGGEGASYLQDNDRYNPEGDSWSNMTDMTTVGKKGLSASALQSNVYTYGGLDSSVNFLSLCDEYSVAGDSWDSKTDLPDPGRSDSVAVSISEKAYLYGGRKTPSAEIATTSRYSPSTDVWDSRASMLSQGRQGASGFAVFDKAYSFGGLGSKGSYLKTVEEYDPAKDKWVSKTEWSAAYTGIIDSAACTVLNVGVVVGGLATTGRVGHARKYVPGSDAWLTIETFTSKYGMSAATLHT